MDAVVEDALVEWYETERVARAGHADAKRNDVIDLEAVRQRHNPALARLFGVIEETLTTMSLLTPATATDRREPGSPLMLTDTRAHA